ncbi:MAG: Gfo/Idh/MocA family oxidoreductase, partial [Candidatus Firestonebacteria bacterium]
MPKVGIVGSGFIGGVHYGSHSKLKDSEVIAFCDIDINKARKTVKGESTGGNLSVEKTKPVSFDPEAIQFYDNYDKMLANKEIEVIDVCLPTYMHKDAVVKAAKAGKHILCEKPMALDLKEADEMIAAVKKAKVKFMVAHVIRFWPEYEVLKELSDKK